MRHSPAIDRADALVEHDVLHVQGARVHNLRDVSVSIPLGRLSVITGVSGSGKSSLAFDTIFAEGRCRYLSSVSMRSRERLQTIDRPDVDCIENLPPVLCVEQQMQAVRNRSTVATLSDLYDFLRVLYARVGQLYCPNCQQPVITQTQSFIIDQTLKLPDRQKIVVLAPVVHQKPGEHSDVFARIIKDGYVRARVDGIVVDVSNPLVLDPANPHDIEIVVDRLILKAGIQDRLEESVQLALQLGQGRCVLSCAIDEQWQDYRFQTVPICERCGLHLPELGPRSFSFNSGLGACVNCRGTGVVIDQEETETVCDECGGSRLNAVSRSVRVDGLTLGTFCAARPSAAATLVNRWLSNGEAFSAATAKAVIDVTPDDGKSSQLPSIEDRWIDGLDDAQRTALRHLLPEVSHRLQLFVDLGVDYLTLDRSGSSLSAGELQRTRLVACLGNQLTGVCYILDEPTAGLHARDTERLMNSLFRLRDEGNTVLLIEHDLDVIRQADYVIDLGPGAGILGGRILAEGTPAQLQENSESVTGRFLVQTDRRHSGHPTAGPLGSPVEQHLQLVGATLHNLKDVTLDVPLNRIVCVTGVSGSGKSSLIMQTLVPAVRRALGERIPAAGPFQDLTGTENISRVIQVDQSPIGRTARSSPATFSGIWDLVRQIFARTKESRLRGFTARRFSLSDPEARCPVCSGRGEIPVDEIRFRDWTVVCHECSGRRFEPATLSIRYRGLNVADVLGMEISKAAEFFENFARLSRTLKLFEELGLGYLKLGQPATTLSGGEAQRIKLGSELAKSSIENRDTLFVLDEPTSGLHAADVQNLVDVLRRLVTAGHSVVVIEHNQQFIAHADWIIEVGPEAGPTGGFIVSAGPG